MDKLKYAVLLAFICGCDSGSSPETERLKNELAQSKQENEDLRRSLPSEQPAVIKDLEEARQAIHQLTRELNVAKLVAEKANSQVPAEVMPMAALIIDLKNRVAELERTASRKGHTHEYKDKYPLNTIHSTTRTTDADK